MTYRGHVVMQTLIRCNFSPSESTGGRFIVTGSHDGRVVGACMDALCVWADGEAVQCTMC
jgi:hypothetical protein